MKRFLIPTAIVSILLVILSPVTNGKHIVMKNKKFIPIILFSLLCIGACKNDNYDLQYYKGEIIQLNRDCGGNNIIKIVKPSTNGELKEGNTISFSSDLVDENMERGNVVYFKILEYQKNESQTACQPCLFSQFSAKIELKK